MSNSLQHDRRSIPEPDSTHERQNDAAPPCPPPSQPHGELSTLPMDRLWTVRQAAAFLARSTSWVYKAAERGELPRARGLGWGLRFIPSELQAYARGELSGPGAMLRKRGGGP